MTFYKFTDDDLFINTLEMYPKYSVYIQSGSVYLDNIQNITGVNSDNILNVPDGHVSLYEYNIDRANTYIYPFIIKSGNRMGFRTQTQKEFNTQFDFSGENITGSYRLSASISRDYFNSVSRTRLNSLKNTINHYSYLSQHYQYTSDFGDKSTQTVNLISIPSIMYGSSIKQGSLSLKYYITGSLIGELSDYRRNGELVQVGPVGSTGSGSVAGVVLYNEGFVVLTGSWALDSHSIAYDATTSSKWLHFGYGVKNSLGVVPSVANTTLSASFLMEYSGTTHTQVVTMMAHAPYGELNHSNNPTFVTSSDINQINTGSYQYSEQPKEIKNIVYSQFTDETPEFKKVTYISKVGIYDKDRNLIGVAKVATPVRKTEDLAYTFKLKLDI